MSKLRATGGTQITSHLNAIEPLQPQWSQERPQKINNGWQKLLTNAAKVNQLSEQLEAALFELKVTASEVKGDRNEPPMSKKIFNLKLIVMPYIHYKKPGLFVISTRTIDIFQQERETLQVAQMLRRRTKRRLKRPTQNKLSKLKSQGISLIQQLVITWQKLLIGRKSTVRNRSPKRHTIIC